MWTIVKRMLPALLALPLLAGAARADDPEDAPRKVTPSRLRTMLENMGYDFTEEKDNDGVPQFKLKIPRDGWTFSFRIAFSPDRSTVWLIGSLREVPAGTQVPPTIFRQMMEKHATTMGRTFFSMQGHWFYLNRSVSPVGLTPQILRGEIDTFCSQIRDTATLWDPTKWPKPRAAKADDDDPPARGATKRSGRKEDE